MGENANNPSFFMRVHNCKYFLTHRKCFLEIRDLTWSKFLDKKVFHGVYP